jgi:hypothetical protein
MNLPRLQLLALFCLLLLPSISFAKDEMGLGIIVGAPTGVSGKLWLGEREAFDGAIGWSLGDNQSFYVYADYLYQDPRQFVVSEGKMPYYFGIGGRLRSDRDKDARLGIRVPLGLEYLLQDVPLNIFIEIALVLDLAPKTDGDLNAGIGVRYRFQTPR